MINKEPKSGLPDIEMNYNVVTNRENNKWQLVVHKIQVVANKLESSRNQNRALPNNVMKPPLEVYKSVPYYVE
jgi:hypothetical protein